MSARANIIEGPWKFQMMFCFGAMKKTIQGVLPRGKESCQYIMSGFVSVCNMKREDCWLG